MAIYSLIVSKSFTGKLSNNGGIRGLKGLEVLNVVSSSFETWMNSRLALIFTF